MNYHKNKSPIEQNNPINEKRKSLVKVLRNSPIVGVKLDTSRQDDLPRDIDLSYPNTSVRLKKFLQL